MELLPLLGELCGELQIPLPLTARKKPWTPADAACWPNCIAAFQRSECRLQGDPASGPPQGGTPSEIPHHACSPSHGSRTSRAETARALLTSVQFYHERHRWCAHLFVLMPDHWHALLSFSADVSMSRVIGDWKKYHALNTGIDWQKEYFDHRLRAHLEQLDAKAAYIRRNPVVAGLCAREEDWPWQWQAEDLPPDTRPESSQR